MPTGSCGCSAPTGCSRAITSPSSAEPGKLYLAGYTVPRGVDFVEALPRNAAGKIERNKVRAPYWSGRTVQI